MRIRIKKLHPDAAMPHYAHGPEEDAGMDLRALEHVVLSPGVAQAFPRESRSNCRRAAKRRCVRAAAWRLKHSVTVNFGTIDPGYRGEIRVVMFNLGRADYVIEKGDRIAQLVDRALRACRVGRRRRTRRFPARRGRIRIVRKIVHLAVIRAKFP